jgi:hypothetical protein
MDHGMNLIVTDARPAAPGKSILSLHELILEKDSGKRGLSSIDE